MAIWQLEDKILYAINPLPEVSDKDVIRRAKLRRRPQRFSPFEFRWRVGQGGILRSYVLNPGESPLALRGKEEQEAFLRIWEDCGGVLVEDPNDADELRQARIDGLLRARQRWIPVGQEAADNYQIRHRLTDEQLSRQRDQLWRWFYNEALIHFIDLELAKLDESYDIDADDQE